MKTLALTDSATCGESSKITQHIVSRALTVSTPQIYVINESHLGVTFSNNRESHLVKCELYLVYRESHLVKCEPYLVNRESHLVKCELHLVNRESHVVNRESHSVNCESLY